MDRSYGKIGCFLAICAKKGPPEAGHSISANPADWLGYGGYVRGCYRGYVVCAGAFSALSNLKINLLVFVEICVASGLNFRIVDEQVTAAVIRSNKTITLV
jgi:hypothetical protein